MLDCRSDGKTTSAKFQMQAHPMLRNSRVPAQLQPFHDHASARAELARFLKAQFFGENACDESQWLRRFAYWWDENPFAHAHPCRGWCLRDGNEIVGYLGTIPTLYEDAAGRPIPALIATSWAVAEGHRHAALPMGLMLQRQGRDLMLVDTTPSAEVQALLKRWGWTPRLAVRRSLVFRGIFAALFNGSMHPQIGDLEAGKEVTRDIRRVRRISPSAANSCVQKHITPDYLRWYLASPMRQHHFVGIVDQEGVLSSYVTLISKPMRSVPTWKVMDWFTSSSTNQELRLLIGWLMSHSPAEHGNWWPFLSLAAFLPDNPWLGIPQMYEREERINHFYWLPPALKGQPHRQVMAEGDWGL